MNTIEHLERYCEQHNQELEYCSQYGEPGYSQPEKCILFANWNNIPKGLGDALQRAGYSLEWSDECYVDSNRDKAWRTEPDCYGWTSSLAITDDCEYLTPDDDITDWIAYAERTSVNQPSRCMPAFFAQTDIEENGWKLAQAGYESGFHPGQTDNPDAIAKELLKEHAACLFQLTGAGQFNIRFAVYIPCEVQS